MSEHNNKKSSQKARNKAARLYAVQAVYQMDANDQNAEQVIKDFKDGRISEKIDDHEMIFPDEALFFKIVRGVEGRHNDIAPVIETILRRKSDASSEKPAAMGDSLLRSILLCGGLEMMAHQDIDGPVIINDYVDVAHAFFEGHESKLVNGVLDSAYKAFRDGS